MKSVNVREINESWNQVWGEINRTEKLLSVLQWWPISLLFGQVKDIVKRKPEMSTKNQGTIVI